ncbi:putative acyl-CoA thioester hydrolase [Novipirellula galeiformis]|uniref:Putative acyl-CoA thioester hydrolase n=1 Tax=Novipirellula galeiformis TaxID=2528004 RepID=A0A5C6BRZ4_9BACT|nr:hotdog domain-containing protein [Novipirellula galeiformis]TWU15023.1 putative acyl-CoA thioester hydrolase [Novipirellula galeiformis]
MTDEPTNEPHMAIKVVMMPRDTNPHGTIFGGVILSYIDQAGAVGAYYEIRKAGYERKPIVTVGMKSVEFHRPVFVGDVLSFWTTVVHVGKTSITMHVDVESERNGQVEKLTEAEVTYVAIESTGEERRPVQIKDN